MVNNTEARHTFLTLYVQGTQEPNHLCSTKLLAWTTSYRNRHNADYVFNEKKYIFNMDMGEKWKAFSALD